MTFPLSQVLMICADNQEVLAPALILGRIGPRVELARSAMSGFQMSHEGIYDLILLDENVTDIPAVELFSRMSDDNKRKTLVLLESCNWQARHQLEFAEALGVFPKPTRPLELVAIICDSLIKLFERKSEKSPEVIIN